MFCESLPEENKLGHGHSEETYRVLRCSSSIMWGNQWKFFVFIIIKGKFSR